MVFKRKELLNELISKQFNDEIKIITGARRVGKSYLLFNIYKNYLLNEQHVNPKNIIEINLESPDNIKYRDPNVLYEYLKSFFKSKNDKYFVFIDEIQYVIKKENPYVKNDFISFYDVLNGLVNLKNVDTYVTGSNSKLLSKDIATEFRGRGDVIHVSPLSFAEVCEYCKNKSPQSILRNYMRWGGMPKVWLLKTDHKRREYLNLVVNDIYINDVLERYKIDNSPLLREILKFLASIIGNYLSGEKLLNTYKSKKIEIVKSTLKKYWEDFQDAYIIKQAIRYDTKGKKYLNTISKYYFVDLGVRNSLLDFKQFEPVHIAENVIFNELVKRGYRVDVGNVFINKNHKRIMLEVDFIASKFDEKYYIQVTEGLSDSEKEEQEKRPLLQIHDGYPKIIIKLNEQLKKYRDKDGIIIMDIYEFLSNKAPFKY